MEPLFVLDGFAVLFVTRVLARYGLPRFATLFVVLNVFGAICLGAAPDAAVGRLALVLSMLLALAGTFLIAKHRRSA